MMSVCPHCGKNIEESVRVCPYCEKNILVVSPIARWALAGVSLLGTGCGLTLLVWLILPVIVAYLTVLGGC